MVPAVLSTSLLCTRTHHVPASVMIGAAATLPLLSVPLTCGVPKVQAAGAGATAGTKVNFVNEGRNRHDLVPATDGAFPGVTQADFGPGRTHVVTFADPGDFPYYCSVHGTMKHGMNGAVRVVAAA